MSKERRKFFRIDDELLMHISPIDKKDLEKHVEDFWNESKIYSSRNEANQQIEQQLSDLSAIEIKMPELARYLAVLQKQVELLSETVLPQAKARTTEPVSVSLSAQGVGFHSDDKFNVDQFCSITLNLLPSGLILSMIARVVIFETSTDSKLGRHRVALNFDHIHETDQEILIKHIHALQIQQLRSVHGESP